MSVRSKLSDTGRRWAALALIVAAMVSLKLALLAADAVPFNSDEAIVGLMARHILHGERPAFFYGQAYLGSTDAWLVSIAFSIIGPSVLAIRLVQIALFAGTLITTYAVARRLGLAEPGARLAVLLMALPPPLLTLYTTATLGGYGETLFLGNLLILTARSLGAPHASRITYSAGSLLRWALFGLLAGFAFWTFGLILIYLIPIALWLLHRQRLSAWPGYAVAGLGFAIGSAPWWLAFGQMGSALIGELAGSAVASTVAAPTLLGSLGVRLLNFFVFGAAAWFGLRYPWSPEFIFPLIGLTIAALYLAALVYAVRRGSRLLWGMIGVLLIVYLTTPFGGDPSGRYFLPLYLPLSIFTALLIERLRARQTGWLAGFLVVFLLSYNVVGAARAALQKPPGITTQFDAVTWIDHAHDRELIDFLLAQGETHGYTNYWVAYPIAFLSGEQIVSAARLPYHLDFRYTRRDDRYLPYTQAVSDSLRAFYVTTNHPRLDALIRERLSERSVVFQEKRIGSYQLFYGLSRKVEPEDILAER
ncbi:MAG TPA: hypothetical protein VJG32_20150 [Anaerolineae bacterium]|nr:hypothetical protein [Anaerolineae bacterium]